jgi:cobalamin biosynthesis protein CobW
MQLNKIPATVVTGFLGSGKTTLLSNIIKKANGKRIAIIVNEFGEMDIDANLLRSCPIDGCEETQAQQVEQGVYELANGCICCTVEEEFLPVMQQLVARKDEIDHILIETSGLALPKPLVQAFNWPEISRHFTVDAVISVVDTPAAAAGQFAHNPDAIARQRLADENLDHDPSLHELFEDQLGAADLIVLNKIDLVDAAQLQAVERLVQAEVDASVKVIQVEKGNIAAELIIGIEAASEKRIEAFHSHHDHHHTDGHHHKHAHDDFDSCVIELAEMPSETLILRLQQAIKENTIYRVKGFAAIPNKPMRQVIQAVGGRIDTYFDRLWAVDETPRTQLVFIGKNLNRSAIMKILV